MIGAAPELGTVLAVDRTNGTVDAQLRSGITVYAVKYQGNPPWKGTDARFLEVADGAYVCLGTSGDAGGFGPNLVTNPEMVEDTAGWDNTASKAWNFDGTTESCVALASTSLAVDTTFVNNGTGSLKVTATGAATVGFTTATGTSGVGSIVPGTQYNASFWVLNDPNKTSRVAQLRIKWYTAAGALISNSAFGATIATDAAVWRTVACTAVAPATAAFAAAELQFVGAASGDLFYADTGVLTGGAGAAIARDATNFYSGGSGDASLSITSSAAGLAYAQTPSPATDPLGGFPVNAGDVYYVDCRFRQPQGLQMFIVAAWVFADGTVIPEFNLDSRSVAGTSSFQYHLQHFIAPSGAVAVHFAFAFIADAAARVLNIDSIKVRQALLNPGLGLVSITPDNFAWAVGGKAQQPGYALWLPNENDFPRLVINGYLSQRALHSRILRLGLADRNLAQGVPTVIPMDTINETGGMTQLAGGTAGTSYIQVPRTGYYNVTGKLTWKLWVAAGANAGVATEVWAMDSTGGTFLRLLASTGEGVSAGGGFPVTHSANDVARVNRDERIVLVGRSGQVNTGHGITTGQTSLQATYVGDA